MTQYPFLDLHHCIVYLIFLDSHSHFWWYNQFCINVPTVDVGESQYLGTWTISNHSTSTKSKNDFNSSLLFADTEKCPHIFKLLISVCTPNPSDACFVALCNIQFEQFALRTFFFTFLIQFEHRNKLPTIHICLICTIWN